MLLLWNDGVYSSLRISVPHGQEIAYFKLAVGNSVVLFEEICVGYAQWQHRSGAMMSRIPDNLRRAIVITGPVGSGKTTVMAVLTELLEERNMPCAGIDMDHLRWFFPKQPGDPFGGEVGRQHLSYMAASYRSLGIPILFIADVIEQDNDKSALQLALPDFEVVVIRLRVPMKLINQRLRQRESNERLQWYLDRAPELEQIMSDANVGDIVIGVGERTPREVAAEIARRLGLI